MTLRTVLQYPDPRLRLKAQPVAQFDAALAQLIEDMIETMFAYDGMGLAAPQINVQQQVIVVNLQSHTREPFAIINPRILTASDEQSIHDEYCLSVIGIGVAVTRPTQIKIAYQDPTGKEIIREVDGLEARCYQHEMDHLVGKVIVDYLSPLKRQLYDRKLIKMKKKHKCNNHECNHDHA